MDNEEKPESHSGALVELLGNVGDIATIPAPIKNNIIKAIGQLCSAAIDVPISYFESKASEMRAESEARKKLIKKSGDILSSKLDADDKYALAASHKFASRIVK